MSLTTGVAQAVARNLTQKSNNQAQKATPFWPQLCTRVSSKGEDEKYGWLGSVPGMREWLGPRQFKQIRGADYTLANKDWESSLEFEKKNVADDRMGFFDPKNRDLADEAMHHPDELLFDIINAGTSAACFDGQFFFDTDHSWGDSGTQDNDLTYNVTTTTDPTLAEFKAAFNAAVIKMLGYKNDQGKHMVRPTAGKLGNLMIVVPLNMLVVANEMVKASLTGGGDSNVLLETPKVVGTPLYTTTDAFDLYYTGGTLKPYVFQARQPLKFQMKGADDIEFKILKAMTEARYNVGYLAWWNAVRTTLT